MEFQMDKHSIKTSSEFGELMISSDEQYGFRPFQLMVSSIVGCSGTVLNKILVKKRLTYDDIKIKADVTRIPEEADRISKIHLHFIIKGQGLDEAQIEKVLHLTRKNCSMVQSVKDSIEVTETFELVTI